MATRAELIVALRAVNEASKVLNEVKDDIKDVGDTAGKSAGSTSKFGDALGSVSKIAGGFILANGIMAAPGFLLSAAQAAAEDEAATARLEQALRNAGGAYEENLAAVNARIEAGQKLAYGDDAVRDSFQQLLAATGDVNESLDRQRLAMDLARGANIDLEAATRMVAKVNDENVEAFRRMGIVIGENATEAEALAAVQAKFAGQADAYASSTAGQMEQASIAMGELKETIGAAVLPALTALAIFANEEVIPAIQAFAEEAAPAVKAFAAVVAKTWKEEIEPALDNLMDAWKTIDQVVIPIVKDMAADVETAGKIIGLALGIIVDLLGGDFSGAWDKAQALVEEVADAIQRKVELLKDGLVGAISGIKTAATDLGAAIRDGVVEGISGAGGMALDLGNAVIGLFESAINSVVGFINEAIPNDIGFDVLGKHVGVDIPDNPVGTVSIPRLARGGVVIAGDNPSGIEAIVPLERAREFGFGGGDVHIHVHAWDSGDVDRWLANGGADRIAYALERRVA